MPELLEEALRKACAWEPSDRFASGKAFRDAIEAAGFVTGERRIPSQGWLSRLLKKG